MSKPLIIAEKPSVAREIAAALGTVSRRAGYLETPQYLITNCIGHLLSICEPKEHNPDWEQWNKNNLPMIPHEFKCKLNPSTASQWKIVRDLLQSNEVSTISKNINKMQNFLKKFTPLQIAGMTFLLLLVGTVALRYFRGSEKNDFGVVYQTANATRIANSNSVTGKETDRFQKQLIKTPEYIFGERLREASALLVSLSVSEFYDRFKSRRIEHQDLSGIINAAQGKKLLPEEFRFAGENVYTENGAYYLRYRVNPFALEAVSAGGRGGADGEIFILRVPDAGRALRKGAQEAEFSSASLWIAPLERDSVLPAPFAPSEIFNQAGWRPQTIQINGAKNNQQTIQ